MIFSSRKDPARPVAEWKVFTSGDPLSGGLRRAFGCQCGVLKFVDCLGCFQLKAGGAPFVASVFSKLLGGLL